MTDSLTEIYLQNASDQRAKLGKAKRLQSIFRHASSYLTFAIVTVIFLALTGTVSPLFASFLVALLILVLEWFSNRHHKLTHAIGQCRNLIHVNRTAIARRTRAWNQLPDYEIDKSLARSPRAIDLDLFGSVSLVKLLCTAETDEGISRVASWMMNPADVTEVVRRQEVAQELSSELSWRQHFQQHCMTLTRHQDETSSLRAWAVETTFVLPQLVKIYLKALPWLLAATLAVLLVKASLFTICLTILVVVNVLLTVVFSGGIHSLFRSMFADASPHSFDYLSGAFASLQESRSLQKIMPDAIATSQQANKSLRRLERIVRAESISTNPWTMLYFYLPLQLLLLWDQQAYMRACDWKASTKGQVGDWLELIGDIEALCSLGSLAYEHPEWQNPSIEVSKTNRFVAKDLGHPLLNDDERIANDITIGPPGSMMLITGSNMGGKSTLLRAIGTNVVLAQMGAVCCCRELSMPQLSLMTSMTASDSLSDSRSLFMSQLLNLKRIVNEIGFADKLFVLYLFDEILNGTNTTDRRVAVDKLVGHLIKRNAIGAMTTHDLEIANESEFKQCFDAYYLGHQLSDDEANPVISYDYTLREGVAPSRNALVLLKILGLDS